jgi:hypothetical protein
MDLIERTTARSGLTNPRHTCMEGLGMFIQVKQAGFRRVQCPLNTGIVEVRQVIVGNLRCRKPVKKVSIGY